MQPWFLVLAVPFTAINMVLRGYRWSVLFGRDKGISGIRAACPAMIGLALNGVLPGKVGEFARVVLAARRFGLSYAYTATTVVVDRLADALTLLALLGISLLSVSVPSSHVTFTVMGQTVGKETVLGVVRSLVIASSCIVVVLIVATCLVPRAIRVAPKVVVNHRWAKRLLGRMKQVARQVTEGTQGFRTPAAFLRVVVYSLLIWLAPALVNLVCSRAIPGIDITFAQAVIVMAISVGVSSIPSTPGAWGIFEAGVLVALKLAGVQCKASTALTFALVSHLCQYVSVVGLGCVAMWLNHLSVPDIQAVMRESSERVSGPGDSSVNG